MQLEGFGNYLENCLLEADEYPGGGASPSVPILFDAEDYKFLSQFPPQFWSAALQWRYGSGLAKQSRIRDKSLTATNDKKESHNKIQDWVPGIELINRKGNVYRFGCSDDKTVCSGGGEECCIYVGYKKLFKKLEGFIKHTRQHRLSPDDKEVTPYHVEEPHPDSPGIRDLDNPWDPEERAKYQGGWLGHSITHAKELTKQEVEEFKKQIIKDLIQSGEVKNEAEAEKLLSDKSDPPIWFSSMRGIRKANAQEQSRTWIYSQAAGILGNAPREYTDPQGKTYKIRTSKVSDIKSGNTKDSEGADDDFNDESNPTKLPFYPETFPSPKNAKKFNVPEDKLLTAELPHYSKTIKYYFKPALDELKIKATEAAIAVRNAYKIDGDKSKENGDYEDAKKQYTNAKIESEKKYAEVINAGINDKNITKVWSGEMPYLNPSKMIHPIEFEDEKDKKNYSKEDRKYDLKDLLTRHWHRLTKDQIEEMKNRSIDDWELAYKRIVGTKAYLEKINELKKLGKLPEDFRPIGTLQKSPKTVPAVTGGFSTGVGQRSRGATYRTKEQIEAGIRELVPNIGTNPLEVPNIYCPKFGKSTNIDDDDNDDTGRTSDKFDNSIDIEKAFLISICEKYTRGLKSEAMKGVILSLDSMLGVIAKKSKKKDFDAMHLKNDWKIYEMIKSKMEEIANIAADLSVLHINDSLSGLMFDDEELNKRYGLHVLADNTEEGRIKAQKERIKRAKQFTDDLSQASLAEDVETRRRRHKGIETTEHGGRDENGQFKHIELSDEDAKKHVRARENEKKLERMRVLFPSLYTGNVERKKWLIPHYEGFQKKLATTRDEILQFISDNELKKKINSEINSLTTAGVDFVNAESEKIINAITTAAKELYNVDFNGIERLDQDKREKILDRADDIINNKPTNKITQQVNDEESFESFLDETIQETSSLNKELVKKFIKNPNVLDMKLLTVKVKGGFEFTYVNNLFNEDDKKINRSGVIAIADKFIKLDQDPIDVINLINKDYKIEKTKLQNQLSADMVTGFEKLLEIMCLTIPSMRESYFDQSKGDASLGFYFLESIFPNNPAVLTACLKLRLQTPKIDISKQPQLQQSNGKTAANNLIRFLFDKKEGVYGDVQRTSEEAWKTISEFLSQMTKEDYDRLIKSVYLRTQSGEKMDPGKLSAYKKTISWRFDK